MTIPSARSYLRIEERELEAGSACNIWRELRVQGVRDEMGNADQSYTPGESQTYAEDRLRRLRRRRVVGY